jgi:hypothetical protein
MPEKAAAGTAPGAGMRGCGGGIGFRAQAYAVAAGGIGFAHIRRIQYRRVYN